MTVQTHVGCPPKGEDHRLQSQKLADNSPHTGLPEKLDWNLLLAQIKAGEKAGMEQLYRVFHRGIRFTLCQRLGSQDLDDRVHDALLTIAQAIRKGDIREPERLMGFVRTVVLRQVAANKERMIQGRQGTDIEVGLSVSDRTLNPEENAVVRQKADLMQDALSAMCDRDREVLVRFYLKEQTQEQICREMELTETQFRLLKSQAKAKFGEVGKKKLIGSGIFSVMVRANHAG